MKYRSIFAAFTAVALSVFLFTSCEKESDGPASGNNGDRLEKFQRLQFSTGSTSTSTNSGSGTFVGSGNSSISFVPPSDGGSINFAPVSSGSSMGFTNPKSTGPNFVVDRPFGIGGGTVTVDGEDYDMAFAFCADEDFMGNFSGRGDTANLKMFIGVAGDFSPEAIGGSDLPIDLILYVFSYNGGNEIGSFDMFEGANGESIEEGDEAAFVIAVAFEEGDQGSQEAVFYFGDSGSVNFTGSEVLLNGVKLIKVEEGMLGTDKVDMSAQIQCASYEAPSSSK